MASDDTWIRNTLRIYTVTEHAVICVKGWGEGKSTCAQTQTMERRSFCLYVHTLSGGYPAGNTAFPLGRGTGQLVDAR